MRTLPRASCLVPSALAVLLVAVATPAADTGKVDTGKINYGKTAAAAEWHWSDELATPLACLRQAGDKYDVTLINSHADRYKLRIEVSRNGRPVYGWNGHFDSVFRILDDRLYYADFKTSGSGGEVVGVDLNTRKELWRSRLDALGPFPHSAYLNRINLDANREVVSVIGNDSMGRYIEFKRCDNGQTVGHKVFAEKDK